MQEPIDQDAPRVLSIVWNLIRGGTEGQCARVAMGLAGRGSVHRVAVFRKEGFFLEDVEGVCGPVFDVGIRRMFTLDTWRRIQALAEFIRTERFDVVHLWDIDAVIFGSIAARLAGVPFVTSRRDMAAIYPRHKLWMMRQADKNARGIVVNAEAIAALVHSLGIRTPVAVQPNILDVVEFDRLAEKSLDLQWGDRFVVGMICRLDPEKDGATFIRGFAKAVEDQPALRAVIAGDGEERTELEELTRKLGVDKHIAFLGEFHDVPALIKRIDVGILVPSHNEGLSNTILEYMAGGKPVIASECGGNRELVIDDHTGILIKPGDYLALSEAIRRVCSTPGLAEQWGRNGRKAIEDRHAPNAVVQAFASYYEEIVEDT